MARKFIQLYETIYNRFKQGSGLLEGDVVKFRENFKTLDCYKELPESIKARIEDAITSGYNVRVGRLHSHPEKFGSFGADTLPAQYADVYLEKSPGMFGHLMTVPVSLLECETNGNNLPEVSDNNKRKNNSYQKPGKWDPNKGPEIEEQGKLGRKQNWVDKGSYELGTKNAKMPGANSYDDSKPSKFKGLNESSHENRFKKLEMVYENMVNENNTSTDNS